MKTIPLTRGRVAQVDDEDYEELSRHKWSAHSKGYAMRMVPHPEIQDKEAMLLMHRQILGLEFGDKTQVDHVDGARLNNQKCNLRKSTHAQNQQNRGAQTNNKSGYKGVRWDKARGLWRAQISVNGKKKCLGRYETPRAAHEAYCKAAALLHGQFARTM